MRYERMKKQKIKDMILEFIIYFSTFEYSLKENGYYHTGNNSNNGVYLSWDRYINLIKSDLPTKLDDINDELVQEAVEFLTFNPPRKQIINNGNIEFAGVPTIINPNQIDWNLVMVFVRRIRNNLFHGEKSPLATGSTYDRQFIGYSLEILKYLSRQSKEFFQIFTNRISIQLNKKIE